MDKRLVDVLDTITDLMSANPSVSMRKLSTDRNEEIQFSRFMCNEHVTSDELIRVLYKRTGENCITDHCLLIEDTTQIGFSTNRSISNLGKLDKGQIQGL
jgi:hypothetical protein